jgi:hypothetical protein
MPVNLLEGKQPPVKIKKEKLKDDVQLHSPEKESTQKTVKPTIQKKIKSAQVNQDLPKKEVLPAVNLMKNFRHYLLKRRLTFSAFFVILLILVIGGSSIYVIYFNKPKPEIVLNTNKPPVINVNLPVSPPPIPTPTPIPTLTPTPTPTPTPPPPPPPSPTPNPTPPPPPPPLILPDTELAPLRGALVRFQGETNIYLVELNGELRSVDLKTVSFLNGQKISQLNPDLIYLIANQFQNVRKGKTVIGKVDWDPRILSAEEIASYL